MELTIKSRILNRTFTFYCPDNGGYIREVTDERPGTLGPQLCAGGGHMGRTLSAYNEQSFRRQCRTWYRAHLKTAREFADFFEQHPTAWRKTA